MDTQFYVMFWDQDFEAYFCLNHDELTEFICKTPDELFKMNVDDEIHLFFPQIYTLGLLPKWRSGLSKDQVSSEMTDSEAAAFNSR